ncbi:MAG TPA: FtsX-like permease family protein [Casimicrobiaceae bacterium]|nr:FtsX-like permease family protein [Casimicrobiaceae bacterium]
MHSATISPERAVLTGSLTQNKTRSILSVLALALGVALGYAVQLITGSAVNELALGVQTLSGDADLQLRGPRGGFDEALYPELARLSEVAIASPVLEIDAKLAGRDDALKIVGVDAFRAAAVEPALVAESGDRLDVLRPERLFLTPAAGRWLGVDAGDTLKFQVALREIALRVGGLVRANGAQRFAVMDIAGAQVAFDRLGLITRVDLRVKPGVDVAALRDRLQAKLPAGLTLDRPEASIAAGASASRAYRVNMNVLALVALFTGGLLVFSTQALSVVRRRTQFALLRVLGVTRRRLVRALLLESAMLGVAGSAIGLVAGFFLAELAVRILGPDLGSGYFRGIAPALTPTLVATALSFAFGVLVALLGGLIPALEAARASPALALKAGDEERAFTRLRPAWPGLAFISVGAGAALLPPIAGLPFFGYAAIALILVGSLMLMPRLAALLLAVLPLPNNAPPRLALSQMRGAPGQVAVSLAAIVASVCLMVSMAIMVTSFREALDVWLERILPADAYLRAAAGGDTAYLTPQDQQRIAALPGVRRVEFLREQQLLIDPSRPRVVLLARDIDPAKPQERLPLLDPAAAAKTDAPPIWVNEAMADIYGFKRGNAVELPLGGKSVRFTVAGVWRDYARPQGAAVIERTRYVALTGDAGATNAALWLAPGVTPDELTRVIQREIPGGSRLELATPGAIRELSLHIFDRTFAVTYALELAAVAIGLAGLSSSFGALVLARRREFGVLRHLGMTRKQIGAMLATEGALASGIGLLVGVGVGCAISLILIRVVNRQSFHWGMELSIPWAALGLAAIGVLALATLTAVASGRRAMSEDVVRAVKEDW